MKARQIPRLTSSAVRAITSLVVQQMRDAGDVYGTVVWWAPHAFVESYQEMFESFLRGSVSDDTIPPVKQPIYRRIFIQLKGP